MKILATKSFYLAFALTLLCSLLGRFASALPFLNIIGSLVLALLAGMAMQFIPKVKTACGQGVGFISNKFLRAGIILLGFRLNLQVLIESGVTHILVAVFIVASTFFINFYLLNKVFKIDTQLALLSSSGNSICGAAAVMGVSPQVKAKQDNAVLAVAVVCIMGTIFTVLEIALYNSGILGMSDNQFGAMAGASLHEIAHAVAAGSAVSQVALETATVVKLSRVIMLAPVALLVGLYYQKTQAGQDSVTQQKTKLPLPWFMLGFLATSAIGTFMPIPPKILEYLVIVAYILLGMAMAGLGFNVNFKVVFSRGSKILVGSFIASLLQLLLAVAVAKIFYA